MANSLVSQASQLGKKHAIEGASSLRNIHPSTARGRLFKGLLAGQKDRF
jgi:hypothetical protein